MEFNELKKLLVASMSAEKNAPVAYSCLVDGQNQSFSNAELNALLVDEFAKYTHENGAFSYRKFQENKNTVYRLIEETITEIIPPRVEQQYMQFADTQTIAQGDRAIFRLKVTEASKRRAKTFVATNAGLAARYETFMLDGAELEVKTNAKAIAAKVGFEEVLDGRWQFADFTTLMYEAIDESIQREVISAMAAMVDSLPDANKATFNGFDETTMDELLAIVDTYGKATIYCTQEFANAMIPMSGTSANYNAFSDSMKEQVWNTGWLGQYKGHNVVILQQSIDWEGSGSDVNSKKAIDPSMAYLIPTGSEKPIKIVFEGTAHVREVADNDDWSTDIQLYTKVGVGTVAALGGNIWTGAYKNTKLTTATRSS